MGRAKLFGGAEVNFFQTPHARPLEQSVEQARGNTLSRSAIVGVDEHLAQRPLMIAEVEQRHRADDLPVREGDPEIPRPLLVELRDVLKVGLILEGDRDLELVPLDADDEGPHLFLLLRGKRNDLNHTKGPLRRTKPRMRLTLRVGKVPVDFRPANSVPLPVLVTANPNLTMLNALIESLVVVRRVLY